MLVKTEECRAQLRTLQVFLSAPDKPEDDLGNLRDLRPSSHACSWIESKPYFTSWRDDLESPQFLWLRARPAFGKSVLASYIVDHLTASGHNCSYFFFKHNDPHKSTLSGLLRSMAYQMAMATGNHAIRESLLLLCQDEVHFDRDDEHAIWRKVFVAGIFRKTIQQSQYWVVDGIDECDYPTKLFPLLAKLGSLPSLRVIITSRDSNELLKSSTELKSRLVNEEISVHDTRPDIQSYAEEQVMQLNLEDDYTCQYVMTTVMEKSLGCFLWVKLVLKELGDAHLRSSIEQILEDVPEGMDPLYSRTLDLMSKQIPGNRKGLIQAILTWVMCAVRPLTLAELQSALAIDIGEEIYRLRQALDSMCSQLVFVDTKDFVQPVHATAREYLLENLESEWAVSRVKGSTRLLETCLKYLTGQEMMMPRNRRTISSQNNKQEKSPFAFYASVAFSDHLRTATASSDQLLVLLAKFLQTNVLAWIDWVVSEYRSVRHLTAAAKSLKIFLDRRTKYKSPLGKEFSTTDAWSIDLERIATRFGKSLMSSPPAIYSLVPALCPTHSAIRRQFGRNARGIEVLGNDSDTWDDRLSCIIHRNKTPSVVACADCLFAVGFSEPPGLIWVYDISTCQERRNMCHPETVRALAFTSSSDLLASSGRGHIYIWDSNDGSCLRQIGTMYESLFLAFANSDALLMAASKGNHTCSWDLRDRGAEMEMCSWYDAYGVAISQNVPSVVVFNHERTLLAAVYKGFPISLWEIEDNSFLGYVHRDPAQIGALDTPRGPDKKAAHPHVEAMVFNPKTDQLAASYADGELCCFDPWSQELEVKDSVFVQTMACSPDGRTLAGGDMHGTIQIRDFRTLRLLYKIVAFDDPIRSLTFTANSLRVLDIRGSTCNVWEPSVLVRSEQSDDENISEAMERSPVIVESEDAEDVNLVTNIIPGPGTSFLVGREDASVIMYDFNTGGVKPVQELYRHAAGAAVLALSWCDFAGILASADLSSQLKVAKIPPAGAGSKNPCLPVFEDRLVGQAMRSVLLDPLGKRLLLSTSTGVSLYAATGEIIDSTSNVDGKQMWLNDPINPGHLLCLSPSSLRVFDWLTLRQKGITTFLNRARSDFLGPETVIKRVAVVPKSKKVLLRVVTSRPKSQSTSLRVLDLEKLSAALTTAARRTHLPSSTKPHAEHQAPRAQEEIDIKEASNTVRLVEGALTLLPSQRLGEELEPLSKHLEQIIDTIPNTSEVVFLDKTLWVCSFDIDRFCTEPCYTRYFFIPHEWLTNNDDMIIRVTNQKDVLLVRRDKLILFKRGLRSGEKVVLKADR